MFPFDCSANCWGAGDVRVYLKADRSNYGARAHPPVASVRNDRACTLSLTTNERRLAPSHQSPASFFLHFSLNHSFTDGISRNCAPQEAAHRRLPLVWLSSENRKLRRSNKLTRNFCLSEHTTPVRPAGRGRKGRSLPPRCPFSLPTPQPSTFISPFWWG